MGPIRRLSPFTSGLAALLLAAGLLAPAGTADAAGLLVPTGQSRSLAIESQKVEVQINNGVAVTTVTQVFRNDAPQPLEALYTFPVPREASVANFSMWINGKEVIGEVLERQRARDIYQQVTRVEKKDPGLLELVNHKTFEMRVFPVPARGTQRIQITYYQPIDYDSGFGTYVYPLEMSKPAVTEMLKEFSVRVDVKSDIPVKRIHSPSHGDAVVTAEIKPGRYRASLEQAKGNLHRDFVLVYELQRERMGINLITSRDKGEPGYFMLLLTPGTQFDEPKKQVNVTFVLDVSGSMATGDRLNVGRQTVAEALDLLRENDTFNIIAFNIAPSSLADRPVPATKANRQRALEFLRGQSARGGTEIVPALEKALEQKSPEARNAILLLSDGEASDLEGNPAILTTLRQQKGDMRIFTFGIGNEVNRPLLDRLAAESGGLADYVSNQDEVQRKIRLMQLKLASPVAEKLRIHFEGVETFDVCPHKLPNLYRGQQLVLLGRYKGAGQAKLTITGELLGRPETITARLDFPETDLDNPQIQRMWAWRKVDAALAQIRDQGESESLRKEIVSLGTTYSIVTPYTAFLVLENEAEYQRFNIERANARRIETERNALQRQWQVDSSNQTAREVQAPAGSSGGGGGGGAVEWVFLAGLGALAGGRWMARRRKQPPTAENPAERAV